MKRHGSTWNTMVFEKGTCAFCSGKGTDPFDVMSARSICCVCGGSGTVRIPFPAIACAHCRSTGAVKTLTCTVCGGRGAVSPPAPPLVPCPLCRGTGDDASAPAMACLKCRGCGCVTGKVKQGENQP